MPSKLLILLFSVLLVIPVIAQDEVEPEVTPDPLPIEAQLIEVDADDGLDLVADFYLLDPARPTVILLHELYEDRTSWTPLLMPLLANGYNLLIPDIRGWGETRGAINWYKAVDDMAIWFTWLREEGGVNPEAIHTMGSSMGSTLAIVGCANDEFCSSAIAISPGWSYYNIDIEESITQRPMIGIYAENDRWPALGVPRMLETAPETFSVISYDGNAHGMDLLAREQETAIVEIIDWLNTH